MKKQILKGSKNQYKIVLRRVGRKKRPFYKIVVLSKKNKYRFYLGNFELFSNRKVLNFFIDKKMFFYWLSKKTSCSYKVGLLLNYLIIKTN